MHPPPVGTALRGLLKGRRKAEKWVCGWVHLQVFTTSCWKGWTWIQEQSHKRERELQKTHWQCSWCCFSKCCEKKSWLPVCPLPFLVSWLSISPNPLEGIVCALQDCELLFAWLLQGAVRKSQTFLRRGVPHGPSASDVSWPAAARDRRAFQSQHYHLQRHSNVQHTTLWVGGVFW